MRVDVSHSATAQIETCRLCVQLAYRVPSDHHKAVGLSVLAIGRTMIKDEGTEPFRKPRSLPGHVSLSSNTITTSALRGMTRVGTADVPDHKGKIFALAARHGQQIHSRQYLRVRG
jgi:hypothetical protein